MHPKWPWKHPKYKRTNTKNCLGRPQADISHYRSLRQNFANQNSAKRYRSSESVCHPSLNIIMYVICMPPYCPDVNKNRPNPLCWIFSTFAKLVWPCTVAKLRKNWPKPLQYRIWEPSSAKVYLIFSRSRPLYTPPPRSPPLLYYYLARYALSRPHTLQ